MTLTRFAAVLTLLGALMGGALVAPGAATAAATDSPGVSPYYDPPFANRCTVRSYAEGVIPPLGLPDDPLCVDYAKRDITVSTGAALKFLLAEPARVLLILGKCQYWQQDHWSIQLAPGQTPVIRWDGSYWYDLGTGHAGARLRGLSVLGHPATIAEAAKYVRPYLPQLADAFLAFGQDGDGAAVNLGVPLNPLCLW